MDISPRYSARHRVLGSSKEGPTQGSPARSRRWLPSTPVLDLVSMAGCFNCERFLGASFADDPDLWAHASPISHVTGGSAPFLFLHGTADRSVPYSQSVNMMNALLAVGVRAEIFRAEGAAHAFFNNPPWYQPTLEAMENFFVRSGDKSSNEGPLCHQVERGYGGSRPTTDLLVTLRLLRSAKSPQPRRPDSSDHADRVGGVPDPRANLYVGDDRTGSLTSSLAVGHRRCSRLGC